MWQYTRGVADPLGIVVFAVAGSAFALYRWVARRWGGRAQLAKRLRRMPRVPVAQVKDGTHVKVAGEIQLVAEPLVSPLGSVRCIWYEVVVHAHAEGERWKVVARDERRADFWLVDGEARALVRMRHPNVGAEVQLRMERTAFESYPWPEPAAAMVRRAGRNPDLLPYYRVEETTLPVRGRVVVSGHAFYEDDPHSEPVAQGYRHMTRAQRLVIDATSRVPLLVSDDATAA